MPPSAIQSAATAAVAPPPFRLVADALGMAYQAHAEEVEQTLSRMMRPHEPRKRVFRMELSAPLVVG